MPPAPEHLKTLEEIESTGIPGLVKVLQEEGVDVVRYVLWDATGWHRDYSPPAWRNRAMEEQKRVGWEMAVRIEKIICTVLHEAHRRQVEEAMETLSQKGQKASTELLPDYKTAGQPGQCSSRQVLPLSKRFF